MFQAVSTLSSDAIWFTGGPLKINVLKKYQKFDEKACYTVKILQELGCITCFSMLYTLET